MIIGHTKEELRLHSTDEYKYIVFFLQTTINMFPCQTSYGNGTLVNVITVTVIVIVVLVRMYVSIEG